MTPYYADEWVTLYHDDCLVEKEWLLSADVLITDPPYGMAYDSSWVKGRSRKIRNDSDSTVRDEVLSLWAPLRLPWAMFGTWRVARPAGTSQVLVWDKTDGVGPGMGDLSAAFGTSHEEVYLSSGWTKRAARRGSVIRTSMAMGNPHGLIASTGHPTPKPASLMSIFVSASSGIVADPFAGSGSTLVAAKSLGRKSIGVEIEERYCEIAAKRLSQGVLDFGETA